MRNFMNYVIYVADVETTGLDSRIHDVIELSLNRLSDNVQKTWCLKPLNIPGIDPGALRVNGHKLEDLKHETKHGRETYLDPRKVIVEIENWMGRSGERQPVYLGGEGSEVILVGHRLMGHRGRAPAAAEAWPSRAAAAALAWSVALGAELAWALILGASASAEVR